MITLGPPYNPGTCPHLKILILITLLAPFFISGNIFIGSRDCIVHPRGSIFHPTTVGDALGKQGGVKEVDVIMGQEMEQELGFERVERTEGCGLPVLEGSHSLRSW